jgi:hypothetical protein
LPAILDRATLANAISPVQRLRSEGASMKVGRITAAGMAVLAAGSVLAMAPAAVKASPAPAPTWTKQRPAAHPVKRYDAAMAYDAATHTVVLFGGAKYKALGDTWTWGG